MAEREIFNPETGAYELMYDDGIYETNPFGAQPTTTAPVAEAQRARPAMPSGTPPPGFEWTFNDSAWNWYTTPIAGYTAPGAGTGGAGGGVVEGPENDARLGLSGGYYGPGGVWVRGSAGGAGGGGGFGRGGGGDWGYLTEPFTGTPPSWISGPTFTPPTFATPPPFEYKQYQAPTKDSIYADPSYQFRIGEGRKALEQSAAGRGTLRTGGTLKDLVNYGQQAASQEYSNIFDRSVQAHNQGLTQALGTYTTNYGVGRDAYDRLYDGKKATFDAQQYDNSQMNRREFDNFLQSFDVFEKNRRRAGDYLFKAAGIGE